MTQFKLIVNTLVKDGTWTEEQVNAASVDPGVFFSKALSAYPELSFSGSYDAPKTGGGGLKWLIILGLIGGGCYFFWDKIKGFLPL